MGKGDKKPVAGKSSTRLLAYAGKQNAINEKNNKLRLANKYGLKSFFGMFFAVLISIGSETLYIA